MKSFDRMLRITQRSDLSWGLLHMTKANEELSDFEVLIKILKEKMLLGSGKDGFIIGDKPAVCFQDLPLRTYCQNKIFEMHNNDKYHSENRYDFFGLIFLKSYIYKKNGRPVFYEQTDTAKKILPKDQYWRIVNLDLSKKESIIDWTHEREWRIPGDFNFGLEHCTVVVKDDSFYKKLIQDHFDIAKEIQGIIPIDTIL